MKKITKKPPRIDIYLTADLKAKVKFWAKELGINQTRLVSQAIEAYLEEIKKSIDFNNSQNTSTV